MLLGAGCGSAPAVVPAASTTPAPQAELSVPDDDADMIAPSVVPPEESETSPAVTVPDALSITMTSGNFFFDPAAITASPGQQVSISFTGNEGVHTFVIDELGLKKSITVGTFVTFTAPSTPGNYAYYCDVGAHRKLGMEGVLMVK